MAHRHALPMEPVNLRRLQGWINDGKVDPTQKITLRSLYGPGRLSTIQHGVKLLGDVRTYMDACMCVGNRHTDHGAHTGR
jgi:hypothetical protein